MLLACKGENMRRNSILIVIISLMLILVACGKEDKVEGNYCKNCGDSVRKEDSFCGSCGFELKSAVKEDEIDDITDQPSETEKPSETTKPSETEKTSETVKSSETAKPSETVKPSETTKPSEAETEEIHKHTYSSKITNATCTEGGYTTYTCSCGDCYVDNRTVAKGHKYEKKVVESTCTEKGYTVYTCPCGDTYIADYTDESHTYTNYICYSCGAIDKVNSYNYLTEYIKTYGTVSGSLVTIVMRDVENTKYAIAYDAQNDCVIAECIERIDGSIYTTLLFLEDGYYGLNYMHSSGVQSDLTGFIEPSTFNENTAMTYEVYTGVDSMKTNMLNIARCNLVLTLVEMERYFDTYDVALNVYALGYQGLQ